MGGWDFRVSDSLKALPMNFIVGFDLAVVLLYLCYFPHQLNWGLAISDL